MPFRASWPYLSSPIPTAPYVFTTVRSGRSIAGSGSSILPSNPRDVHTVQSMLERVTCPSSERKTVAVLVDYMNLFAGGFEAEYRRLFERFARVHDLNLVFVYGRALAHPDPGFAAHNRIYELLSSKCVSGVIALTSSIAFFCGLEGVQSFFQRYASLARCSVSVAVPNVPSVEVDNRAGMRALLEHLIVKHSYRRIAFIRGPLDNLEANVRFGEYCAALDRHGIEFDESLVQRGSFARRDGNFAAERILARSGKRPEVIMAANDGMALGAVSQLRSQGIRVPQDIAVTGFDNFVMARLGEPPLTTVAQPLEQMVKCAIELIVQQLAGSTVPDVTELEAQFVIRESCGCSGSDHETGVAHIAPQHVVSQHAIAELAQENYRVSCSNDSSFSESHCARILNALAREFTDEPKSLIHEVESILFATENNETFQTLQTTITHLRYEFAPIATLELEDLWYQACSLIALTNTRRQEQLRLDRDQAYYRWIDVGERFGAALDLATLTPALTDALLTLGIDHAYISHYTDDLQQELECIVAIRNGAAYEPLNRRFPADALMPSGAYPTARAATFLAFPLAFNAQNLGVAVFEMLGPKYGYPIIRDQISGALRSIALHQEILNQTRQHERRVQEQERQATAERIQSLSVLAGGVAHDLNNVLGPLVALPDLMASEFNRLILPDKLAAAHLSLDLETLKAAALRATQTIKDLLTLGRQGHASKEPLDINLTISRCIANETTRTSQRAAHLTLEICSEPLFILGSESHLERAVTNLVRNAIDAVSELGKVTVRTLAVNVDEPILGYETVPRGQYAAVAVSDDGCGIQAAEIGRLFEPFFSKKRLNDHSGSGLGLAIVHGVVKEHGGFIDVESAAGKGTTFTLYLPRSRTIEKAIVTISDAPHGNASILVVDDEPLQLRTCGRVLTHLGYSVVTLSSGRQALAQLQAGIQSAGSAHGESNQSPYDLVILDMLLNEEHDGLWVFDIIRSLFPMQRGIIASGHAPNELLELARQRGLSWLSKPYTQATLARAVQGALTSVADPRGPLPALHGSTPPLRSNT